MHSESKGTKTMKFWYEASGKKILFVVLLLLTGMCCEWPDFHPEHFLGSGYHWWLDMIFHGGYYFVITLLLYVLFCGTRSPGRQIAVFYIAILLSSYTFEALQAFVPGRSVSVLDLTSNLLGISLATILGIFFYR